jgi:hypothetical protein
MFRADKGVVALTLALQVMDIHEIQQLIGREHTSSACMPSKRGSRTIWM